MKRYQAIHLLGSTADAIANRAADALCVVLSQTSLSESDMWAHAYGEKPHLLIPGALNALLEQLERPRAKATFFCPKFAGRRGPNVFVYFSHEPTHHQDGSPSQLSLAGIAYSSTFAVTRPLLDEAAWRRLSASVFDVMNADVGYIENNVPWEESQGFGSGTIATYTLYQRAFDIKSRYVRGRRRLPSIVDKADEVAVNRRWAERLSFSDGASVCRTAAGNSMLEFAKVDDAAVKLLEQTWVVSDE